MRRKIKIYTKKNENWPKNLSLLSPLTKQIQLNLNLTDIYLILSSFSPLLSSAKQTFKIRNLTDLLHDKCENVIKNNPINVCNHTPTPIFCSSSSKTSKSKPKKLLNHFRRSRDCTEHCNKPLNLQVTPRGLVLSRENFQWIIPTKFIKKEKQSVKREKNI